MKAPFGRHDNWTGAIELISTVITHCTWRKYIAGNLRMHYTDNNGALGCLRNGNNNKLTAADCNRLAGQFSNEVAVDGTALYLYRVRTDPNLADEPSQGCMDLLRKLDAQYDEPVVPDWVLDIWRCHDLDWEQWHRPGSYLTTLD